MTYATSAPEYRARGFAPFPVFGKSNIPTGVTGRAGTVTDEKIQEWIADPKFTDANIGLRPEGWISIDVDDYEDKHGAQQLEELEANLGMLPATPTNTARGPNQPSRQHFFIVPPGLEFKGKAAPDIDILQHSHRFALVAPSIHPSGRQYQWYDADDQPTDMPTIDQFERLPEAWLEFLLATDRPTPGGAPVEHPGFVGSIKAWLDILPEGAPTEKVRHLIDSIPAGPFGHDELVKLTFRIVRLGSENHTGVPQAIDALYDAWTRPPFESYAPAFAVALEGAIRKAGKPQAPLPTLLRAIDVLNDVTPELFDLQSTADLATIASAAFAAGLSDAQTLTLLWNCPAGQLRQPESDALEAIWREVQVYRTAPAPEPAAAPATTPTGILTDAERALVAGYEWWGTQYIQWVKSKVDYYNAPFHRLGAFAVLSTIASPWGVTAIKGSRPTNCALYMAIPAPSTVGKTDALGFVETVVDAYYGLQDSPNLGTLGKLTSNALHRAVLMRDGKASFVYTDEAQSFLRDITENSWQGTLLGDLADYYGLGVVGAKQMMNDKDFSGVRGKTFLTAYLTGIDDQMADAMDISMWTSGLFYRFIWAIADPRQPDRDEDQADPTFAGESDVFPRQWAAQFKQAEEANLKLGKERMVSWDADAWARHNEFRRQIVAATKDHPRFERIINPALTRFAKSVIKCATLIALIEASPTVTMRHELLAIEAAEEWLAALILMIDRTSESPFDRYVAEMAEYIGRKPVLERDIYRTFKPSDLAGRALRQLELEGRTRRNGAGLLEIVA